MRVLGLYGREGRGMWNVGLSRRALRFVFCNGVFVFFVD